MSDKNRTSFPSLLNESGNIRCYMNNCNLIPLINIKEKNGKFVINSICRNGHSLKNIPINEFLLKSKSIELENQNCYFCKLNEKNNKIKLFFCPECQKYVCRNEECEFKHKNCKGLKKENLIDMKKFDDYCIRHGENLINFCIDCQKSFCCDCDEHKKHKISSFINIGLNQNEKNILDDNISKAFFGLERMRTLFNLTIEQFKKEFDSYYEMNKNLLILNQLILRNYKKDKNGEIILNVINNVKYLKKDFFNHSFKGENMLTKLKHFHQLIYQSIYLMKEKKNINRKISYNLENNFKTLKEHSSYVYNILFLEDGRLSSCSSDSNLIIYTKTNYTPDLIIKEHSNSIFYHTQLRNKNIVTCSYDKLIKIIKLLPENKYIVIQTLIGHDNSVLKILETYDNKLISCSSDLTMKVWEENEKNKNFYCIQTIFIGNIDNSDTNILLINENEIVSSSCEDKFIIFWNLKKNFSLIQKIENIDCNYSKNSMHLINDNSLLIGGYENNKGIYLINIINHQIIKNIVPTLNYVYSIIELINGTILIGAFENNKYCLINYKFENYDLIKIKSKESAHKGEIYDIIGLDNGIIISCSDDSTIKFWN